MRSRVSEFFGDSQARRRANRFQAVVETLDARQLMAAGITGVAGSITGAAGYPLTVKVYTGVPPTGGGTGLTLAPVGTPVPLVTLTSSATGTLAATGFVGTVDWGDGSAVDTALFGTFSRSAAIQPDNTLIVNGPDHTYQSTGTYPVTIAVTEPGDATPTVFHATATVTPITIGGNLNFASDTGYYATDSVTAINTPTFGGTTQPGALVVLTATNLAFPTNNLVVGTGVTDASGNWSITTVPFIDGRYAVAASVVVNSRPVAETVLTLPGLPLTIDTRGPHVDGFQVNARTGAFAIGFSDPYGLAVAPLTAAADYVVTRTSPAPQKGQTFAVSNLTSSSGTAVVGDFATTPVYVTGTLTSASKPIKQNGTYVINVHASTLVSQSGVSLDGAYAGHFPTGNGQPGSNFKFKITIRNGKASAPIAIG